MLQLKRPVPSTKADPVEFQEYLSEILVAMCLKMENTVVHLEDLERRIELLEEAAVAK